MGSTSVASVAASGVLVAASGVVCYSSLFSFEIAVSKKLLTSNGARTKTSVSRIKQVALVRQQHEAFGLQGRVVDVAHVGQAHPCYKSRTAEYPLWLMPSNTCSKPSGKHWQHRIQNREYLGKVTIQDSRAFIRQCTNTNHTNQRNNVKTNQIFRDECMSGDPG